MNTLPFLSQTEFRQKLAGLIDPDRNLGEAADKEIKDTAIRFCTILAKLFGESLDRTTLWSRIDTAISTSVSKVGGGESDLERWASFCLDHVKADAAYVAACEPLLQTLEIFTVRPQEWRKKFLNYIQTRRYAVVVFARNRWEEVKKGTVEL